jgi:hypothetical protein
MTIEEMRRIAMAAFDAYRTADRAIVDTVIGDPFCFTSPYDDHIDRAEYFRRCWPAAGSFKHHHIVSVVAVGDDACIVLYNAETRDGRAIRNVERIRFSVGRIAEVEVFFGLGKMPASR